MVTFNDRAVTVGMGVSTVGVVPEQIAKWPATSTCTSCRWMMHRED